jgi:uncharacterized UPF0160 family protein
MKILDLFKKKKLVITHNGGYHADDVFACAALSILEKGNIKIIRTRDPKLIEKGDYVVDVGRIYDENKNRFDHHQKEGAGKRQNGILYASFGLVWKKYGRDIAGSAISAQKIDEKIAMPIDAIDNGQDIAKPIYEGVRSYSVGNVFGIFMPTWQEPWINTEKAFYESMELAKKIIGREVVIAKSELEAQGQIETAYKNSANKQILVLGRHYPESDFISAFPEVVYIIRPRDDGGVSWSVKAVRKDSSSFENKKNLPLSWGGLEDKALQQATGVPDAIFCHKALFLASAKSREGAIRLAQIALNG